MKNKTEILALYDELKSSIKVSKITGVSERTIRSWISKKNKQIDNTIVEQVYSSHKPELNFELKNGTIIVFSDAHVVPHEDLSISAQALLEILKELKPQIVVNGGDIFDFASISKHDKLGWDNQFTVKEELEAGMDLLEQVAKVTPGALHIAIEGNHDTRFNKFLSKHIPQFKGVPGFNFTDHLPKEWRYAMSILINNNTIFLHGWHGGVHCAFNNVIKSGISIVTGHTHTLDIKPFTDYNGTRFGISTGTLATIQNNKLFAYTNASPLNWQAGFVVLTYIDGELQYPEVCNVNAAGHAVFRGKVIV